MTIRSELIFLIFEDFNIYIYIYQIMGASHSDLNKKEKIVFKTTLHVHDDKSNASLKKSTLPNVVA